MGSSTGDVEIQDIPANIGFHSFTASVAERTVRFEVMKFKDSIYMWIGDGRCRNFTDISFAMMSKFSADPTSTHIMGDQTNLMSVNLATKLSKKLKKPVYVSYNLPGDRLTTVAVNEKIAEELKTNHEKF